MASCFGNFTLRPHHHHHHHHHHQPTATAAASSTSASSTTSSSRLTSLRSLLLRRSNSNTKASSSLSDTNTTVPREDPLARKRRLILIRRQASLSPLNLSVGFKSRTGWQPLRAARHNQDALAVVLPLASAPDHSLFVVCDGHGQSGHRLASFLAYALATHFETALTTHNSPAPVALRKACARAEQDLLSLPSDLTVTGACATMLAVSRTALICANVGDSRVVLATADRAGHLRAVPLTSDHSPADPAEQARVEAAGARVDNWSPVGVPSATPRVWLKDKRLPGLSLTRVFGDSILAGVVAPVPDLTIHHVSDKDMFAVVASDGLWAVMSNQEVVDFVHNRRHHKPQFVAEAIVQHAARLWYQQEEETIDDISVIVVRFNKYGQ